MTHRYSISYRSKLILTTLGRLKTEELTTDINKDGKEKVSPKKEERRLYRQGKNKQQIENSNNKQKLFL